jgi:hypothetical protein
MDLSRGLGDVYKRQVFEQRENCCAVGIGGII